MVCGKPLDLKIRDKGRSNKVELPAIYVHLGGGPKETRPYVWWCNLNHHHIFIIFRVEKQ